MKLLLLLTVLGTARAEFLRIEVFMKDMNCASCSDSMGKAFEKIRGVQHVDVSMDKSTVTLELILIDNGSLQSLGTAPVPARPDALLRFPVPAGSAIRQFNELEVVFHRDRVRIDRSARIAIERFVLVPRQ